jgi:hypothetical protein
VDRVDIHGKVDGIQLEATADSTTSIPADSAPPVRKARADSAAPARKRRP